MSGPSFVQQARIEFEVVKNGKKVLRKDHPCLTYQSRLKNKQTWKSHPPTHLYPHTHTHPPTHTHTYTPTHTLTHTMHHNGVRGTSLLRSRHITNQISDISVVPTLTPPLIRPLTLLTAPLTVQWQVEGGVVMAIPVSSSAWLS